MKLRNQVLSALIFSGLLPLAIAFLYAIWHSSITTNDLVIKSVSHRLAQSSAELASYFSARETEIDLLASLPLIQSMDFQKVRPFLMNTLDKKSAYYEKFIVGRTDGSFHNTSGGNRFVDMLRTDDDSQKDGTPRSIAQRDYWLETIANNVTAEQKVYISNPMISYTTEVKQIVIAASIINNKQVVGLIGGSLPWENIQQRINKIQDEFSNEFGGLAKVALISSDGTYWYHWQPDKVIHFKRGGNNDFILNASGEKQTVSSNIKDEFPQSPTNLLNTILTGKKAYIVNELTSSTYHHLFQPIDNSGYTLQLTVDDKVLSAPTSNLINVLLLILMISIAVALLAVYFLSKKLTQPLYDFASKISLAKNKQLAPIAYTTHTKEFNDLFQELNRMIVTICDNEKALRISEERFSVAMKGANDGLWDWNLLTDEVYFSPRWKDMLGYQESELANNVSTWQDLIFEEDLEETLDSSNKQLNGQGHYYRIEFRMKHKNGTLVNVLSRASIIYDVKTQKPIRLVGTHVDITDRKKQEYQLHAMNSLLEERVEARTSELANLNSQLVKATQVAEHANQSKSLFLANMSHEIRTPMNGVIGLIELITRTPLNAQQQEYLTQLQLSSNNLMHILNDILDISKIEAGKLSIEQQPFDFKEMLTNVVKVFEPQIQKKKLSLTVSIADDIETNVIGDSVRCSQVLTNLVNNAIKFTEVGGIRIIVNNIENSELVSIKVSDTGIGISEQQQQRLFTSFMQADDSTSRKFGGTGLGLAISQQLACLMGGAITLQSKLGEGSCFEFKVKLPIDKSKPSTDVMSESSQHNNTTKNKSYIVSALIGKRVLLVEDNRINRLIAEQILKQAGMKVFSAENGLQAVQMAEEHAYDVIVMDIQMPVMDGYEATQKIRLLAHHEKTPIIAMTANAMTDDKERSLAVGMNKHLTKPIKANEVIAELSKFFT
ncbi:hypothetical protein GCM10009111_15190 [Colwellia asteriadis]|uniref:histidine kinase n=1 Tax=Colwellia asteriadis TaxID=517723 RepID=A0ABN1L685_9GAMM